MLSFDQVTSSELLPLNDFDIPTLFHCSSGSRFYPDISFALFALALSCSWEVLQNLCSNHYQFYQPSLFRPNERLPSLNFRKARQDDFAFYFDSHCPSAKEYSSLFLSFAASSSSFGRNPHFQMLAVMVLSQHRVSTSKTVSPRIPVGAQCTGHVRIMCVLRFVLQRHTGNSM